MRWRLEGVLRGEGGAIVGGAEAMGPGSRLMLHSEPAMKCSSLCWSSAAARNEGACQPSVGEG
jgi:hypothetical protein